MGSWKIMAMSLPRMRRRSSSSMPTSSRPRNRMLPPETEPGGEGISPMTASAAMLLPLPDSPTMPRVSPPRREKPSLSTATAGSPPMSKLTSRPLTSRMVSVIASSAWG